MRLYFRHARTLNRLLLRYLEQKQPSRRRSGSGCSRPAVARKSNPAMASLSASATACLKSLNQPALSDRSELFSLFTEAARTGVPLSRQAERCIAYIMQHPELPVRNAEIAWPALREILGPTIRGSRFGPCNASDC